MFQERFVWEVEENWKLLVLQYHTDEDIDWQLFYIFVTIFLHCTLCFHSNALLLCSVSTICYCLCCTDTIIPLSPLSLSPLHTALVPLFSVKHLLMFISHEPCKFLVIASIYFQPMVFLLQQSTKEQLTAEISSNRTYNWEWTNEARLKGVYLFVLNSTSMEFLNRWQ